MNSNQSNIENQFDLPIPGVGEMSNFSGCKLHMARDSMPGGPHAKHVVV